MKSRNGPTDKKSLSGNYIRRSLPGAALVPAKAIDKADAEGGSADTATASVRQKGKEISASNAGTRDDLGREI
jgi:hypothetical protein